MSVVTPRRIELWAVERLKPYARNARTHSAEQIDKIAASIATYGFNAPILVDSDDGIVAGHGRLEAAKSLGMTEVPVIVLDHLSEQQRQAYLLVDNRLSDLGGWDMDMLALEIETLQEQGLVLEDMGFTEDELSQLLDEPFDTETEEIDDTPPPTEDRESEEAHCICPNCGHQFIRQL